jgi:hypothetical protein
MGLRLTHTCYHRSPELLNLKHNYCIIATLKSSVKILKFALTLTTWFPIKKTETEEIM